MVISIAIWIVLGAAIGGGLAPLVPRSLARKDGSGGAVLLGLTTAVVFGLLAWRVSRWPDLVGYSAFAAFGIAGSVVDIAEHRLPARLVLPTYPVVVGLFGVAAILQHDLGSATRAAVGLLVLPGFYLAIALVSRGGIGAGDIRLAGPTGWVMAWHSWASFVVGTMLAFVFASVAGLAMIAGGSATRHSPIPFGPAMVAGALTAVVLSGA